MVHIVLLTSLFFSYPELNKKYPFRFFTFATLFLFMSLRFNYGNDYMGYYNNHSLMNAGVSAWGTSDYLFYLLNVSIPNFFIFIAVISLFYLATVYHLIKTNLRVKDYWFAILILLINPYLFLVQLSSLRQTLAICLFIFAVNFAVKKKLILYIAFVVLASEMHSSALLLLPLYFIMNEKKFNKKWVTISLLLMVILLFSPIFDMILNKAFEYFPHYRFYYEQGNQNSVRATLISSVYFFVILFNLNKLKGKQIIYGKLSLIATGISILAIKVSMLTRIGMYFDIFLIITLPQLFREISDKKIRILLFALLITIYLLRYYSFFTNPLWESYKNYKTILGAY
jgi:hypothetical protein